MGAIGYARARAMGVPYGTGKVVPVGPVVTMTRRGSYGGSRRRSYRRRSNYGGNDMSKYMPFGVGAALGYMGPKIHPMQDTIVMALAVLPAALGVPRQVRYGAQGYVAGMLAKGFLGGRPLGSCGTNGSNGNGNGSNFA